MVGVARIELATPAMSTQCSTTELHAHLAGGEPETSAFRQRPAMAQPALDASAARQLCPARRRPIRAKVPVCNLSRARPVAGRNA